MAIVLAFRSKDDDRWNDIYLLCESAAQKVFKSYSGISPAFTYEDLRQYVLAEIWARHPAIKDVYPYAYRAANNYCSSLKKKEIKDKRVINDLFTDEMEELGVFLEEETFSGEQLLEIAKSACSKYEYTAIYIYYWGVPGLSQLNEEKLTLKDVANYLDLSESTVKSHLLRGRKKIRKAIEHRQK